MSVLKAYDEYPATYSLKIEHEIYFSTFKAFSAEFEELLANGINESYPLLYDHLDLITYDNCYAFVFVFDDHCLNLSKDEQQALVDSAFEFFWNTEWAFTYNFWLNISLCDPAYVNKEDFEQFVDSMIATGFTVFIEDLNEIFSKCMTPFEIEQDIFLRRIQNQDNFE